MRAALYATHRPQYPIELFDFVARIAPRRTRAWDCATGSGQAAIPLADHFDEVIATDASEEQIKHSMPRIGVRYRVAPADASGIPSHSVDLVTVAQALHWFDTDAFFEEASRVLTGDGAIACWGYGDPVLDDPSLDAILHSFNRGLLERYWAPNRDTLLERYATIQFPFREIKAPSFKLEKSWTLGDLVGYLRTWSATAKYIDVHRQDPVPGVERSLRAEWGEPYHARLVTWPIYMRAGHKD